MRSIIPWFGGKSRLAKTIIPKIPAHICYVEPFAGAGNVFFRKEPSQAETLNDLNSDLVTLYRVVQHHLSEFVAQFKYVLVAREEFKRLMAVPAHTLTDIQRAARFYYLIKSCYGGKSSGQTFGYSTTRPPRLNLLRIEEELSEAHLRLCRVNIENLAYTDCIYRYDRPETFFYIDPPYWGCEDDYGKELFSCRDFERLADILKAVKGRFILSLNDVEPIKKIYKGFKIERVPTQYSISNGIRKDVFELLISNF